MMSLAALMVNLVVLFLYKYTKVTIAVKWSLRTDPIVFKHDVTLFCSLPNNFNKGYPRQWKRDNKVLISDEGPANKYKYEGLLEQDGFTLTIKNFAMEDFSQNYSCLYGFEEYTANLKTTNYQWQPEPGTSKLIMNSTIDEVQLVIQFEKVYPEPSCTSLIGVQPIEANLTNTKKIVDRYFFAVNMNLEYVYGGFECGENISVVCKIGNKSEIFAKATPRHCAAVCQQQSPCLNNATCTWEKTQINCNCSEGYTGDRCEITKNETTTATDPLDSNAGMIVPIVVTMIVLAVVCVVVYKLKKTPKVPKCMKETCFRDEKTSEKKVDKDPSPQEKDCTKDFLSKENGATNETHEATESVPLTNMQIDNQCPPNPSTSCCKAV